jgi:hypothetical protein
MTDDDASRDKTPANEADDLTAFSERIPRQQKFFADRAGDSRPPR